MKNLVLASIINILAMSSQAYAGPFPADPNLDPQINCVSIGIDSFGDPLSDPTKFEIQFKPLKKEFGPTTDKYSMTVITSAPGQQPKNEMSVAKINYHQDGSSFQFIILMGPNFDQSNGRFTSFSIPGFTSAPFIIYGWSKIPTTVGFSIEYRCKIQDAY